MSSPNVLFVSRRFPAECRVVCASEGDGESPATAPRGRGGRDPHQHCSRHVVAPPVAPERAARPRSGPHSSPAQPAEHGQPPGGRTYPQRCPVPRGGRCGLQRLWPGPRAHHASFAGTATAAAHCRGHPFWGTSFSVD